MDIHWEKHPFTGLGIKSWYISAGTGEPLLFIHGLSFSPYVYKKILDNLAQLFTVYSLQLPPFDSSGMPKKIWDYEVYGSFVESFLKELNISSAVVVGHSFGGAVALSLATTSHRISRLILLDPADGPERLTQLELMRRVVFRTFLWFLMGKPTLTFLMILTVLQSFITHLIHLPRFVAIVQRSSVWQPIDFHRIRCPTLILWGNDDELLDRKQAKFLAQNIPQAKIEFVNGFHNWCVFQPERVAKFVKDFTNERK